MLALAGTPADAAQPKRAEKAVSLAAPGILGSFTPSVTNPRAAAVLREAGSERGFRFTPSSEGAKRRNVTVAVRSRAVNRDAESHMTGGALMPSGYDLGVSIGWRGLSLSGEVGQVDGGLLPFKQRSVDLGLSYSTRKWRTTLRVGEKDESEDGLLPSLGDKSYNLGLGGAYSLSRNFAVTGGVRYQLRPDGNGLGLSDQDRDDRAVYLGTSLAF